MDNPSQDNTNNPADKTSEIPEARNATVLQVLPAMGTSGGVERGTVEIANAVNKAGGRAIVVSAGGAREHDLSRVGAEHITMPVDSKNPLTMYANIARLRDLIRRENVDIVHARSRAPAWSAWYAAKKTKTPFVTTFHGTYSHGNPFKRFYNSVMTRGERVIAISNFIAGHIRRYYGVQTERIRIIHRGVDLTKFNAANVTAQRVITLANEWRITEGFPVVMLPGRLTRWKGQTIFIEAIAKLDRRDIRCLLVGGDQGRLEYRKELEAMISKHDLGEVVRLVESCRDMPAAYMLSDVVISASTDPEAFGRVAIEAQALGRPIIATDHGGAKETVIENVTGWLVPPGDSSALANAIEKAVSLDEKKRAVLAIKATDNIRDNFSTEAMCKKTLDVYDEVLASRAVK
ncbi:MAG: glycosyltransferase family 4 protein [Rhodospirillales bacterium]|jgi:glycosyltransferase involved in cell wall biosynthesis|nr:glycosyltransferase family 4 protein [Rhodospirillales bacterium]